MLGIFEVLEGSGGGGAIVEVGDRKESAICDEVMPVG